MYIAIDLIIIVIMLATIVKATKQGFVKSLFGMLTAVASLVVAILFYKELGLYLNENYINGAVSGYIEGFVNGIIENQGGEISADTLMSALPSDITSLLDTFGIDLDNILSDLFKAPANIATAVADELSLALANAIAYAAIFLAAYVGFSLVCRLLNLIVKLPVLKGINRFFGFVLGVVEAAVLGIIIAKLAVALCGAYGTFIEDSVIAGAVEKTVVAKFMLSIFPW